MSATAVVREVKAKKSREQAAPGKTIAVLITPENAELCKEYERCRGLIGAQEVSQKALVTATKAAHCNLLETFSKDAGFQEYLNERKGQKAMATQQISPEEALENVPITHEKQPAAVESLHETMTPEERQIFDRVGQMQEVVEHFQTNVEGIPFGPNDYKMPREVRELQEQLQQNSGRSYDEWKERLQGVAVAPEEPKQQEVPQQQQAANVATTASQSRKSVTQFALLSPSASR